MTLSLYDPRKQLECLEKGLANEGKEWVTFSISFQVLKLEDGIGFEYWSHREARRARFSVGGAEADHKESSK